MATLRPAAEVRAEIIKSRDDQQTREHRAACNKLAREIEEHKFRGYIFVLPLPETVVAELKRLGYGVAYHRAAGMGDVDTHQITW